MQSTKCVAPLAPLASDFAIVYLRGGRAEDARDALAIDCDRGLTTRGEEWSALVPLGAIDVFLHNTGADQIGDPAPWDGSPFGDGAGGVVEIADGELQGRGLNARALPTPKLCGAESTTTRVVAGLTCALCADHAAQLDAERA